MNKVLAAKAAGAKIALLAGLEKQRHDIPVRAASFPRKLRHPEAKPRDLHPFAELQPPQGGFVELRGELGVLFCPRLVVLVGALAARHLTFDG